MKITLFLLAIILSTQRSYGAIMTHGPVVGGVTHDSAIFWARSDTAASIDFEYSTSHDLATSTISHAVSTLLASDFTVKVAVKDLQPSTIYYYTPRVDGVRALSSPYAQFKTPPIPGIPVEFTLGVVTDFQNAFEPNNLDTYVNLDADNPDWVFIGGDFDHRDPSNLNEARRMRQENWDRNISPIKSEFIDLLVRKRFISHAWDDHDYGCNNGDKTCPMRSVSLQVFDEYFPVPVVDIQDGIYHKISYGHVDFFILDVRSNRDANNDINRETILGQKQKDWLFSELAKSSAIWKAIWVSTPWNQTSKSSGDGWGRFPDESKEIAGFIKRHVSGKTIFLSGDLHAAGIDIGPDSLGFWNIQFTQADLFGTVCESSHGDFGTWNQGFWSYPHAGCPGYGVLRFKLNPHRIEVIIKDHNSDIQLQSVIYHDRPAVSR